MIAGLPNPGSAEASAGGCLCPRMDNCYGNVAPYGTDPETGEGRWIINMSCPMHGTGQYPFSPDLDLIGDLDHGQRAAWEDPR